MAKRIDGEGERTSASVGVTLGRRSDVALGRKVRNHVWRIINAWVFPVTFRSHRMRCWLLRSFGASLGKGVRVGVSSRIEYPWSLIIGDNSSVGEHCYLQGLDVIRIGANVCVSDGVSILTGGHDLSSANFALFTRSVCLEDGVWIAFNAMVLPGVTCGRGAVAGAGAVVHKSVEEFAIVAGNPAMVVGRRTL